MPRGYFLDGLAMLAVFLRGAEPQHDRYVLRRLGRFRTRIQGLRGWPRVRACLRWVEGQEGMGLAVALDLGDLEERLPLDAGLRTGPV